MVIALWRWLTCVRIHGPSKSKPEELLRHSTVIDTFFPFIHTNPGFQRP